MSTCHHSFPEYKICPHLKKVGAVFILRFIMFCDILKTNRGEIDASKISDL